MRFVIGIYPYDRFTNPEEIAKVVTRAEELGYWAVGFPEHLLPPPWAEEVLRNRTWYDLPTLCAYLAAATSRIRFLMSAHVLPYHHPVRLAKALATLDVISKGRVLCGVGVGWMEDEFNRLGVPFAERGAITDEYLRAMQVLWTEETPRFIGRYVAFAEARFEPKPVQRPHIPLLIGGSGPRALRRAAELGDGWYPMMGSPAEVRAGIARIRELAVARGRDPAALLFGYTGIPIIVDEDTARAAAHVQGTRDVPPARRLSRDAAAEVIEQYAAAGVQFLSVGFAWRTTGQLIEELERFAGEVMPAFAEKKWEPSIALS